MLLGLCGITVEIPKDIHPSHGVLVVANHISWLDIFVLNVWCPFRFVAKSEIRAWPLIGWLCVQTGTLFLERGKKRDTHRILHRIAECLGQGDTVCVFPEGTTSDGTAVLPFHANLLQAAVSAKAPVLPVALRYLDTSTRSLTLAPAYIGDLSLMDSLNSVLDASPITVQVLSGTEIAPGGWDRRELSGACQMAVGQLLGEVAKSEVAKKSDVGGGFPACQPSVSYGAGREAAPMSNE
ncbi:MULTISPECIES: lysophospholipid acyltransferase family protein [unclassified Cupriavidus]|uniref:lysophospholipid acyltransferase family protein n=1 Tax=unclassified Cupriavidus TaxID=2640874 RepID=UPI0002A275B0|nr:MULTISPECIES: lysophospholipid acyltransferase family protein [unclassified Cupriavidus]EKZ98486.1 phospholipid/glycerol acyltransferase [Cupriavidus sp. HMR-1]